MNDLSAIRLISKSEPDMGRDWPDECKDAAFEAWALLDGQVCTKVAERLASGYFCDDDGEPQFWQVAPRMVQKWAIRYDWQTKRDSYFAGNFPALRRQIAGTLILAAVAGGAYMQEVNEGRVLPNRDRVASSMGALDRVGFSPVGSRDVGAMIDNAAKQSPAQLPDVTSATVDELMRIERDLRSKRRTG